MDKITPVKAAIADVLAHVERIKSGECGARNETIMRKVSQLQFLAGSHADKLVGTSASYEAAQLSRLVAEIKELLET